MNHFDRSGTTLEENDRRRSSSRRPRLGDRIARTFGGFDRTREELPEWESAADLGYPVDDDTTEAWDAVENRFPLVRSGYDPSAVDEHIASLERELEAARRDSTGAVSAELEKVGEQTSAILLLAHDKAGEITRAAQEQADRCVADASSNAVTITEQAKQKLRQLDAETESIWDERARLLEDARAVARELTAMVESAASRFAAEADRGTVAVPAVGGESGLSGGTSRRLGVDGPAVGEKRARPEHDTETETEGSDDDESEGIGW